jgi:N-succinyldiaminopimelate aminotransferase
MKSIFDEMAALARRHQAIDLSSGTPRDPLHAAVREAVERAIRDGHKHYAPVEGVDVLRDSVAEHAQRFYGQRLDPESEVTITSGVTEGLHAALQALVRPGDDVVVLEPCYHGYVQAIQMAGGRPLPVRLRDEPLRPAFERRPRAIIVNTPHNPTGAVLSRPELEEIAALCQEFDVLAISDEVYEHFVYDGARHVRLATLDGMRERTLTLGSAGKTLACTGWRLGWAVGPAALQEPLREVQQFIVFSAPTPLQHGVAAGLRLQDSDFEERRRDYEKRRDFLTYALQRCGLEPRCPEGGFFVLTRLAGHESSRAFCLDLAERVGVVPVPLETFYCRPPREALARFAFCAGVESLQAAAKRLQQGFAEVATGGV